MLLLKQHRNLEKKIKTIESYKNIIFAFKKVKIFRNL